AKRSTRGNLTLSTVDLRRRGDLRRPGYKPLLLRRLRTLETRLTTTHWGVIVWHWKESNPSSPSRAAHRNRENSRWIRSKSPTQFQRLPPQRRVPTYSVEHGGKSFGSRSPQELAQLQRIPTIWFSEIRRG